MRYLAIFLLSVIATATSSQPSPVGEAPELAVTLPASGPAVSDASAALFDAPLALLVGGALVALQLRRRHKSFGMPRPLGG